MSSRSRSLSASGKRSFTITNAYHVDGCPTKFSHKDYTGRFTGHSAQRAAQKALSELCRVKKIRGQCTLYIEMRETTQGSSHKLYAYHVKRHKLKEPIMIAGHAHYYETRAKPVRIPTEKCHKSHKSSGRMKSFRRRSKSKSMSMVNRTRKSVSKTMKSFF